MSLRAMNGHAIRHMGPRDLLLVILTASGFGSSFLFINLIVAELPPVTLACARTLVSLATLYVVMVLGGIRLPPLGRVWLPLAALGAASQVVPMILLSWSQRYIASGLAGIILGSVPVLTLLLAHMFMHDERISMRSLTGALIGFGGVIAVIGPSALGGVHNALLAELAVFGAALSVAAANIIGRQAGQLSPVVLATGSQAAAAVMLVPMSLAIDQPWGLSPSWSTFGFLLVLGILGSALPGLLFYRLLTRVGATRASLAAYLVPLVAVVLGAVVLDERLAWTVLAGMVLILAGAALVNRRIDPPATGA